MNDVQLQTELQHIMLQNNWSHQSMFCGTRRIGVTKQMIENLLKNHKITLKNYYFHFVNFDKNDVIFIYIPHTGRGTHSSDGNHIPCTDPTHSTVKITHRIPMGTGIFGF